MAAAIYNGVNKKENCIHYIKALAEIEREEIEKSCLLSDGITELSKVIKILPE